MLTGTPDNGDVGTYSISLVVSDDDDPPGTTPQSFTIEVVNVNDAPTGIQLDSMSVDENQDVGTLVGTLNTDDVDVGDTHTYTLVTGTGDGDNNQFNISGYQLLTSMMFNYEEKSSYSIRVQSTDSGGETVQKAFTITIENINDQPVAEDQILYTSVNTDLAIDLSKFVRDEDTGDELNMVVTINPVYGTLSGVEPNLVYTPDEGFTGSDSFTFIANDGTVDSEPASVTISVLEHHCLTVDPTSIYTTQNSNVINESPEKSQKLKP